VPARLSLALGLAVVGVALAVWSLWPMLRSKGPVHATGSPKLTAAAEALRPSLLDTDPRRQPLADVIVRASDEARAAASRQDAVRAIGAARLEDLLAAFEDRLRQTIDADYERDVASAVARGMPAPPSDPPEAALSIYEQRWDWTRNARLGLGHIEVRIIFENGERIAPTAAEEGYQELITTKKRTSDPDGPNLFPIPADARAAALDIVEVRLPVGLRALSDESRGAVLVGYQFAWNDARRQWTPFVNVVYHAQGETHAGVPLF